MNKLLTNTLLLGALSIGSISAFAQTKKEMQQQFNPTMHMNEKGNGGDRIEQRALTVVSEIGEFFIEKENQKYFPEVNFKNFLDIVRTVNVIASEEQLKDKFGAIRCLRNYDKIIEINKECWAKDMLNEKDQYAILFHELLGIVGVETAGKYISSSYKVSSRIEKFIYKTEQFGLLNKNVKRPEDFGALVLTCQNKKYEKKLSQTELFYLVMKLDEDSSIVAQDYKAKSIKIKANKALNSISNYFSKQKEMFGLQNSDYKILSLKTKRNSQNYNLKTKVMKLKLSNHSLYTINFSNILSTYNYWEQLEITRVAGNKHDIFSCDINKISNWDLKHNFERGAGLHLNYLDKQDLNFLESKL